MDRETITKSAEEERNNGGGISRRDFLKTLGITGAGIAFFSAGSLKHLAQADSMGAFTVADLPNEKLIEMYTQMLKIRFFDCRYQDLKLEGKDAVSTMCPSPGEEAVGVGVIAALNLNGSKGDQVISTHRPDHHLIPLAGDLKKLMAEYFLKSTGYTGGYGNRMHIVAPEIGFLGSNGIVGAGWLLGAGAAYAIKVRGTKQVAVTFGGEGAATQYGFGSAMTQAAFHKLPWIAVVENNGYEYKIPSYKAMVDPAHEAANIAKGHGLPAYVVDGQDILAIYRVAKEAVERARAGEGTTLIHLNTYRYYDHHGPGPDPVIGRPYALGISYRSDRELFHWLNRDPIKLFKRTLIDWKILTDQQAGTIEDGVKAEVEEAIQFAREASYLPSKDGVKNVYKEGTVLARQFLS